MNYMIRPGCRRHIETVSSITVRIRPLEDGSREAALVASVEGCRRILSIYQHKEWWLRPAFPQSPQQIPEKTQLLLLEGDGGYLAFLAVCGPVYRTDMEGDGEGVRIVLSSNLGWPRRDAGEDICLILAEDADPYRCCEKAVGSALKELGHEEMQRRRRRFPAVFEKLGWCSWDAFYQKVSQEGICSKLQEFKKKELPVKWVLIDDGWMEADYKEQLLEGMDADKDKFPEGLAGCTRRLKEEFDVEQVGVWHAIMGYWSGLKKGSPICGALADVSTTLPDGRIVAPAESGKAFLFYHRWHEYLRNKCGIDFVKVDGQSGISTFYAGVCDYGTAGRSIQAGLNASAALHFDNAVVNCMGMAPEDMWNRPSSALARSSDDFLPGADHGFWEHALQNGFNSLLQGQFFWGDWDMFWSGHEEALQNALLRAISGGPVYTSDPLDQTDASVLWPLIRQDGTVIRCHDVGMPTIDCLFEDPTLSGKPLKLFNRHGENFAVAAFHLGGSRKRQSGRIRLSDLPCGEEKGRLLYDWHSQKVFSLEEEYEFGLDENQGRLFWILPKEEFVPLGILEKFISPGCISYRKEADCRSLVAVNEEGTFGFVSRRDPERILCDGKARDFQKEKVFLWDEEWTYCRVCCKLKEKEKDCLMEIIWQET